MSFHSIKQNDRRPQAATILKRGTTVVDLTLASSVTFIMRNPYKTGDPKVRSSAVILDAEAGSVEYRWLSGDTDTPGEWFAEWEVTWGDGTTETFPTVGYDFVLIQGDLDS